MASDAQVTPKILLDALQELDRRGSIQLMQELEGAEPELAEQVIEGLSCIYHHLSRSGASSQAVRKVYRLARRVVLVSVMSLRRAHFELWRQQAEQTPLASLDDEEPHSSSGDPAGPPPELT